MSGEERLEEETAMVKATSLTAPGTREGETETLAVGVVE